MPSQLFKVPTISIDGFSVGQVIITISEFFITVFNVIIYFLTVVEILISLFLESLPCYPCFGGIFQPQATVFTTLLGLRKVKKNENKSRTFYQAAGMNYSQGRQKRKKKLKGKASWSILASLLAMKPSHLTKIKIKI